MRQEEKEFWDRYSGIDSNAAGPAAATAADAPGPGRGAVGVEEVARRLSLSAETLQDLADRGELYAYRQDGDLLFPQWQFTAPGAVIPWLHLVLKALPANAHPGTVAGFFLTLQPDLVLNGRAVNAKEWLETGEPPEPVLDMARNLSGGY